MDDAVQEYFLAKLQGKPPWKAIRQMIAKEDRETHRSVDINGLGRLAERGVRVRKRF